MIKLTGCARRLPHLSHDEFDAYWRDHHGPLVRSYRGVLRIRRYVQTSTLTNPAVQDAIRASRDSMEASFDGYAEVWWDSLEEMAAIRQTDDGAKALRALLEDERRFVDLRRSQFWYGIEREIISG
jgi:uncharacterized protein (TIGR02118 family)